MYFLFIPILQIFDLSLLPEESSQQIGGSSFANFIQTFFYFSLCIYFFEKYVYHLASESDTH